MRLMVIPLTGEIFCFQILRLRFVHVRAALGERTKRDDVEATYFEGGRTRGAQLLAGAGA